uniref:Uncharacterized protein n=1 Tax=Scleropages formosus TaxID=113540 RepID=A0A8C9V8Z4_SCLFO
GEICVLRHSSPFPRPERQPSSRWCSRDKSKRLTNTKLAMYSNTRPGFFSSDTDNIHMVAITGFSSSVFISSCFVFKGSINLT